MRNQAHRQAYQGASRPPFQALGNSRYSHLLSMQRADAPGPPNVATISSRTLLRLQSSGEFFADNPAVNKHKSCILRALDGMAKPPTK